MADTTGHKTNAPIAQSDPLLTFMFALQGEIQDPDNASAKLSLDGYFTEISGPGDENDVVEFKTVNVTKTGISEATILLPGRNETNEVTLKRGITKDMTFWKWRELVRQGRIDEARTNLSIIMYNRRYDPVVRWDIGDAWPKKITGPDFQAGSSDFGVEEIIIVYHTLNFTEYTP